MAEVMEIDAEESGPVEVATSVASPTPIEDSAAEADLENGFANTSTDVTDQPDSPAAEEVAPTPGPIFAKITEDEYKRFLANAETVDKIASSLEQRFGTAFGHIGGIQQKLKEMQANTPSGQSVKLTKEDFAEMQAEFPELAELQMKGFERAMSRMTGTAAPGLDEAKAAELVDTRIEARLTRERKETLTELHEDWETVVGAKDSATPYRSWLATQPEEYQAKIHASQRPGVIAESITKFKTFAATPPPAVTPPRTNPLADARREQLREAVVPKGNAGGSKRVSRTEEDDLQAGFDAA